MDMHGNRPIYHDRASFKVRDADAAGYETTESVRSARRRLGVILRGPCGRPRSACGSVAVRRWPSTGIAFAILALCADSRSCVSGGSGGGGGDGTGNGSGSGVSTGDGSECCVGEDAGGGAGVVAEGAEDGRGTGVGSGRSGSGARRASSRMQRPSFHFSESSCARRTRQPR